eukprot:CAMPEP_0194424146 /NCGR_PEP_ID=MMETSP0176-20130528/23412_1 /TAXON_ID=216777 /ORGANISM="Proboscia alata, Strain PI-D3" /LENGTH=2584 /DNA_ID=CAMNT_0039233745 /DNA_START=230 /DNA_END=7984 /DNA_ORIENTATION=+
MRKTCKNKKNTDSLLFAFVGVFLFLTSLVAAVVPPDTAATTSYRNINSSLTQYCVYEYLKASNYNVFSSGLNYTVSKLDENGNSNFFIQAKNDEGVINIGSLDSFDGNKAFYTGGDFCPVIDSNITGSFKVIPTSSSVTSSNIALAVSEIYTCSYEMTLTVPETNSLEFDASGVGISSNVCGSIDTQDYGVTYTMLGGGNNILGTSDDSFFFARVSMPATDFTAVVFTEDGLTNDDSSEPAVFALMVRDSMDPKSRQFSVVLSGGKGVHAFYRSSYGSVTQLLTSGYNHRGGCWLKITRISDNLKAYYKPKDKENFIFIGEKTIGMDGSLEVGLGLASWWGSNRNSEKVEFSNFVVTTPVPTISPLRIISPSSSLLPALSLLPSSKSSLLPSSFKCSITETMFNLELMTDYYTNEISWELIDVCCSITETVLHLELRTGNFEDDISWELVDVFDGRKVVLSANTSTYSRYELHNEIYCIEIAPCYQFLIHGEPEYKLFYNEKLLLSSRFDQSDISMIFGDSCSSSLPSMSPNPSALSSYSPTSEPSQSSMPSILPLDFIVHDKYNRRYFPERPIRLEESFPYQPVPNCTSSIGRVGCIAVPISSEIEPPHWVGTLYYTPPYCNNRTKECTVSIPIPRKSHTLGSDLIPVITNNFYERKLPGEHEYMNCVAVGDVNNDGWLDIVIATYYRSNQLLINDGDGNFRNSVDLPGGAFITNFVAVGDFNNDGWLDIVIGNRIHRDGRNQILINDGDGTFSRVVDLPSGDFSTESVAVGDINNDGWLDIVIGINTQNNQLLVNNGDGNFLDAVDLPGGAMHTQSVALGDFNNDGLLDIVIGNWNEKNQLLLNNSDGQFHHAVDLPGGDTQSVALGDFNNDGWLDIVVGDYIQSNLLLINDGNGNFPDMVYLPGSVKNTASIAVGDINNDGLLDIVIGNSFKNYQHNIQFLINDGNGCFPRLEELPGSITSTKYVAFGDVNKDGLLDIVTASEKIYLLVNGNDGKFIDTVDLPGNEILTESAIYMEPTIAVGDINNDGLLDIVIGNFNQNIQLLINEGNGNFLDAVNLPGGAMHTLSVALGDINNDGLLDIVIGNDFYEKNQLLLNVVNGTFIRAVDLPGGSLITTSIVLGDFNNDGWLDIVVGNYKELNLLLINDGNGNFPKGVILHDEYDDYDYYRDTESVSVGDVNNDGMLDVIIGNRNKTNQLLINDGDGNFHNSIDLPGSDFLDTKSVAVGDFNNDGWLDILIGNYQQSNQLLVNDGEGTFPDAVDLHSGALETKAVAVGDINNDGFLDIVIGSYTQNNQLLINDGDGNFRPAVNLPGGILLTSSVAIGDMNNDGWLDIVVGSELEKNKLLPYSPCPNGGARLHSKSWCFRCPSFMGKTNNFCRECMPDYMQRSELLDEQCEKCPLGDRTLGKNNCSNRCLDGTYYNTSLIRTENSPSTWTEPRCESCSPGEYATQNVTAINECFKCMPGTYQPSFRSNGCLSCRAGEFQTEFGKEYCEPCSEGGYCNASSKLDGGFTPCPPGTFNDKLGQSNEVSCEKCPVGTFSTQSGANNSKTCMKCLLGTYNNRTGQTQCHPCDEGTFQSDPGQILCHFCPNGTYADRTGFKKCVRCPYPLSSKNGSNTCAFCDAEFYLKATDYEISPISIFQDPFKYCLSCPPTASCNINSSIQNIDIPKNYWRYSESTSKLYLCDKSQTCLGTTNTKAITRHRDIQLMEGNKPRKNELTGIYCKEGHTGPLCEICVENDHYFSIPNRQCSKCPSLFLFAVELLGICFGVIVGVVLFLFLLKKHILSFLRILQSLYPQAKVKLIVSFYQVLSSLEDVYGVTISSKLKNWMNIVKYLSLNFIQITGVPVGCVGSTKHQLIVNAVWPFMVIMFAICFLLAKYCVTKQRRLHCRVDNGKYEVLGGQQKDDKHSFILLKKRSIQWSIIVLYFALPVVSQRIFDAIKCRAFQTNDDDPPDFQSHLLINMSIVCNSQIKYEYASILVTFWVLFTVWILLIPLGFVVLLKYIGPSVRSKSISSLADASRFLWQDYDASMWFWDIVDTYRKIFLSGAILLIDTQKGSNKILRLVVAIIVSVLYFGILLAYRPYKRSNDYNLAFLSNFLLISCFSLGIILKLCTDNNSLDERVDDEKDTCDQFIGLSLDSFKASVMVVILSMSMLLVTVGFLVLLTINKITAPTVFMVSSGYAPDLELPEHCNFHVFMSHVWGTGQAKTHAITRNIQLFLPGLKVWLDVDDLQDISKLEDSVAESVVFVLYYSRGYFRSKNCRREIYAAMYLDKPIIVLYEGDDSTVEDMKNECMDHCGGNNVEKDCPGSACILKRLLEGDTNMKSLQHNDPCCTHGPIQWLNEGCFSAAAKNRIYSQILGNLPHYKRYPNLLLEQGIRVPGELSQVSLDAPINILTHRSKHSCSDVAEELKTILPEEKSDLISVYDARMFFKKNMQEIDSFLEDDRVIKSSNQAEIQHNDLATPQNLPNDNPSFLLLYLNKFTFEGCAEYQSELASVIQSCIDQSEISIVLVHEKDIAKGGCDFGCFFTSAPEELIKPPNNLFRDIATPLYKSKEYRIVSLRQILCKMGGKVVIEGRKS